ncbi:radical SAM protein [Nanoarchaeota archaeon]
MVKKNKFYSYNLKKLPKGCQLCIKGEKLVLFVTGLCPRNCYFCPVSDQKYQKDVIFANERSVKNIRDIYKEAELMDAKGAGLTGGDPLTKLWRTCFTIRKLKKKFGKNFHIHLYTSLDLITESTLKKLHNSGLDEIRFHLDLDSKKHWDKLRLAKKFKWDIGVEIPLIPKKEKQLKELIDFIQDKVDFLNLNELEVADNKQSKLSKLGYSTKNQLSYAVKGSIELGIKLINYIEKKKYKLHVHACTAKLKDKVQLSNRVLRESKNAKHSFDIVDDEGILTRGAIYLPELKPSFGYREKIKKINKKKYLKILKSKKINLKNKFIDENKVRILTSKKELIKNKTKIKKLGLIPAIVKEYPTADQFEVEVEFV